MTNADDDKADGIFLKPAREKMPEDTLLKALEDDSRVQCERIISEAGQEAAGIVAAAEKEALSSKEERLAKALIEAAKRRAALLNNARSRAGAFKLEARHEAIEEAIRLSVEGFSSLPDAERRGLVRRLYEGLKAEWKKSGLGRPIVYVNPSDEGAIGEAVEVRFDEGVSLGVVFTSEDGRVRFENTVRSRAGKAKKTLVPMIDRTLFGE